MKQDDQENEWKPQPRNGLGKTLLADRISIHILISAKLQINFEKSIVVSDFLCIFAEKST